MNFDRVYTELTLGLWEGGPADAADVLSMPVSILKDAIEAIKEVKKLAKKVEQENKKSLILKILEGILFLIPFVGGLVGGLGRAGSQIARFLAMIELAGSAGIDIYCAVKDRVRRRLPPST